MELKKRVFGGSLPAAHRSATDATMAAALVAAMVLASGAAMLPRGVAEPVAEPVVLAWMPINLTAAQAVASEEEADEAVEIAAAGGEDVVVYRVPVQGVVEMGLAPFIERSLKEAAAAGAHAVILEMETPGGRIDAAWQIAGVLGDAPLPVYTYVNRHAISAGALIALATERIYMRTGSVIGAATPVMGEGQKAPEKMVSAMRSEMRALAEARGLDPRVAEAMVDEDIEIDGVIEAGKLLTLTASEAAALGYAVEVDSWGEVLANIGLTGALVTTTETNWAESLVRFLTHPLVTPLLLSLGFLGLIFEVKTPGFGLGGAVGMLSLFLFFGSHYIIGLAGWEELLLLSAGLVLLALEIFLIPGFGIFGLTGIVAILASMYLSMVGKLSAPAQYTQAAAVLSTTLLVVIISTWAVIRSMPGRARLLRAGILLGESMTRETGYIGTDARPELVGAEGVTLTDLRPAGAANFGDARVDVVSEAGWIPSGTPVRIIRSEGYRHVVRAVGEPAAKR